MDDEQQYRAEERRHCNRMIAFIFFSSLSAIAFIVGLIDQASDFLIFILILLMIFGSSIWILLYGHQREVVREAVALDDETQYAQSFNDYIDHIWGKVSDSRLESIIDGKPNSLSYHPIQKVVILILFYVALGSIVYKMTDIV